MPKVNFDPVNFPQETILRIISRSNIHNAKTLDDLKKIAKEVCDECTRYQIKLEDVLYELEDENIQLKNKIEATKLKTLEEVTDFLTNKNELKDFILAMESAIDEATKPRRFFDIREQILEPRQIETEVPKRKVIPEIEFPAKPRPGIDFQT